MTNKRLDELLAKVPALRARAKIQAETRPAPPTSQVQKNKQMSLELWPEAVRNVPNAVLRGSLFGVSRIRPVYSKRTLLASVEGIQIRAKGQGLNQADLDVWENLLHLARLQPLGNKVEFTAHALLQILGRQTGKTQHEQLKEDLSRLATLGVEITWTAEQKTFFGTLVSSFFRDEETGRYVLKFNQDFGVLYGTGSTYLDWGQRRALGQNSLAKWLHGFYCSHARPYAYSIEKLKELCGSTSDLKEFKRLIKAGLSLLVEVGSLKSWDIDQKGLVTVVANPSGSQKRHLKRARKY